MTATASSTIGQRLAGQRPGRGRALFVASIVGVASGVVTYKLLRSGDDED